MIPVEISWEGVKDEKQVIETVRALRAPCGVNVDGSEAVKAEGRVVCAMKHVFLLM